MELQAGRACGKPEPRPPAEASASGLARPRKPPGLALGCGNWDCSDTLPGSDPGPFTQMAGLLLSHQREGPGSSGADSNSRGPQEALGHWRGAQTPEPRGWGVEPLLLHRRLESLRNRPVRTPQLTVLATQASRWTALTGSPWVVRWATGCSIHPI